jgi:hypothetical protein
VVVEIVNYAAAAAGVAALLYLVWVARRPDADRAEEDDARAFFDVHGHWPDEPPEAARPLGPPRGPLG